MTQVKVYGLKEHLCQVRETLGDAIHRSLMHALQLPEGKRFQRFISLSRQEFIFPPDRSSRYTIVELSIFEGRSEEVRRSLISTLFAEIEAAVGISAQDLELTIFETPRCNWGIRGENAADLTLTYPINRDSP